MPVRRFTAPLATGSGLTLGGSTTLSDPSSPGAQWGAGGLVVHESLGTTLSWG